MRVGVLVGKLNIAAGGSHTYSIQILNYLEKNTFDGFEFTIICSNDQFVDLNRKFNGSVISYVEKSRKRFNRYLGYLYSIFVILISREKITRERIQNRKLIRILDNSSFDLIWSIEPLAFSIETPYMTTVWDLEHRRQPYFPEVANDNEWERRDSRYKRVLSKATFIVTGTNVGKEQIEKFYGVNSERIIVAPFPMISSTGDKQLARDPNLIFYPAQFWAHKNHVNLILGLKLATKFEPSLRLVLVGSDKGHAEKIRRLVAELKLEGNVEFWGTVSNEVLENLYRTSSLMIYPSLFGPDNLPPLEAISFKCPLAVADQPGSREQLLDGVPFFDPTDETEISKAILNRQNYEVGQDYYQRMLLEKGSSVFFREILGALQRFQRIARNFAR